jgi:Big-like domain-containing protein
MLARSLRLAFLLFLSAGLIACLGSSSGTSKNSPNNPTANITSLSITPNNSAVTVGKTLQFSAEATYSDGSKKDVTSTTVWQTSDPSVATVSTGVVTGLKAGLITVRAGSGSVTATTLLNVTSKQFSKSSLNGAYVLTLLTGMGAPSIQLEAGSISADGNGNVKGEEDINGPSGVVTSVSLSGTYTITADGRGTLSLTTTGQAARTFRFVLYSNPSGANNGVLIEFDGVHNAMGKLEKQDQTAFTNTALANATYVFREGGLDSSQHNLSVVGEFATDSTGSVVSSGEEDVNDNGTINNGAGSSTPLPLSGGTIGAIDGTSGRATMSLTGNVTGKSDFALYIVSDNRIEMLGLDADPVQATAEKQSSPAPSSVGAGGYVFLTDMGGVTGQFWMEGQMGFDNTSHFTEGVAFQDGGINFAFVTPAASFTITNGRGTFQQTTNHGTLACVAYLVSASEMYLLQTNDVHAASGIAQLQSPGPDGFNAASLNNTFVASAAEIGDGNVAFVAEFVSDGLGHIFGIEDVSQPQAGNPSKLTVSTVGFVAASTAPNVIGGISFNISSSGTGVTSLAALLVSSNSAVLVGQPNDADGIFVVQ